MLVTALARNNEYDLYIEDEGGEEGREPKIQESFDSPVYDPSNFISTGVVNGKVPYNIQASVRHPAYLEKPYGFGFQYLYNPYSPYNRYGIAPYTPSPSSPYGAMLNPGLMSRFGYGSNGAVTYRSHFGYLPNPYYISGFDYSLANVRRSLSEASAPFLGFAAQVPSSSSTVPTPGLFTSMAPPLSPAVPPHPAPGLFAGMAHSRYLTVSPVTAPLPRFYNDISRVATSITGGPWAPPSTGKGGQMASISKPY